MKLKKITQLAMSMALLGSVASVHAQSADFSKLGTTLTRCRYHSRMEGRYHQASSWF
jgi:hypothetical protein